MATFRCPTEPQSGIAPTDDIIGCGTVFDAEPDDEGLVDCPKCGIWFRAEQGKVEEGKSC